MTFNLKHIHSDFPYKSPLKKQNLKPAAAKRKAERDKAYAMGKDWNGKNTSVYKRKEKKAENQRIGQSSDKDIHHVDGEVGNTEKISVHANRGNNGKGTKNEG